MERLGLFPVDGAMARLSTKFYQCPSQGSIWTVFDPFPVWLKAPQRQVF